MKLVIIELYDDVQFVCEDKLVIDQILSDFNEQDIAYAKEPDKRPYASFSDYMASRGVELFESRRHMFES